VASSFQFETLSFPSWIINDDSYGRALNIYTSNTFTNVRSSVTVNQMTDTCISKKLRVELMPTVSVHTWKTVGL